MNFSLKIKANEFIKNKIYIKYPFKNITFFKRFFVYAVKEKWKEPILFQSRKAL